MTRAAQPAPRQWTLDLSRLGRPTPMNKYRTLHHHARAQYDKQWREGAAWEALRARIPKNLTSIMVNVVQGCRTGTQLPDVGANYPTAKAAIDGLIDAGVIADDTPGIVAYLGFAAPEHTPTDRFVLLIDEVGEDAS